MDVGEEGCAAEGDEAGLRGVGGGEAGEEEGAPELEVARGREVGFVGEVEESCSGVAGCGSLYVSAWVPLSLHT